MTKLLPFIFSYVLPGLGQLMLRKLKKAALIFFSYTLSVFAIFSFSFLDLIPFWALYLIFLCWALFDVYKTVEKIFGKRAAKRRFIFSFLFVFILFPIILFIVTSGIIKGGYAISDEFLNEDRTKTEMNEIKIQLEKYKEGYGIYPEDYSSFISRKPIWKSWEKDAWQNSYKYQLLDSINYRLVSMGKDGKYSTEDDIVVSNKDY